METPQIDAIAYYSQIRNENKKQLVELNELNIQLYNKLLAIFG